MFVVARIHQRIGGRGLDVRQLILGQFGQAGGALLGHRRAQVLQPLRHARIAAGLQQVGAAGDRQRAARQDGGDVHRIRAGGVGDVEVAVELVQQLVVQVHRDRVERPARHVHLVARHALGVVVHRQGVAQLDPEGEILLRPRPACSDCDQLHRLVVLQVMLEDRVGDHDLGEAQPVVQDIQHPLLAQQRGVHLDDRVQPALLQGVAGDALDLVGRAAVHRGEGDAVGQLRRDLDVGELRELAADDLLDLRRAAPTRRPSCP